MNKKIFIGIAVLVVVGAAIYGFAVWRQNGLTSQITDTNKENPTSNIAPETQSVPTETLTSGTNSKLSYTDALKRYGTNRLQFDATCQMIPSSVVYKAGTQVMFDNRANARRTINFNGRKITIAAYDYAVVSMTASSYPAPIYVDCDAKQNVGRILIEK